MRNILLILLLIAAGVFSNRSQAQTVILKADTIEVPCTSSDTFLVPIRLDNFTNISGLQFTLQWDTARLDYAYTTQLNPNFVGVGFDTSATILAEGKLTFAWTDLAGVSVPNDAILFQVAFRRIGGPPTPVSFVNTPTDIAVFDNQFNQVDAQTINGLVKPLDNQGPSLTCPANVTVSAPGSVPVPNIPPVAADNCGTPSTGWASTGATVANFPNDPDASGAVFNIGASQVTYTTTDAGGNTATCSFEILVEFAVSSTDLTLIASPNNAASCGESVTIDVLAFNFDSIAGLQFSLNWLPANLEYVSITNTNATLNIDQSHFNTDSTGVGALSFAWTSGNIFGSTVPDGEVLFTLTYNVLGGGSVQFTDNPTAPLAFTGTVFPPEEVPFVTIDAIINVTDTIAPTITCPANQVITSPGAAVVNGIAPVVDDNCSSPNVGWSSTGATVADFPNDPDASGSLFNLGSSTVVYTATDASGNSATCSFDITVEFGINTDDLVIVANSANAACGGSFSMDFTTLNFETVAGVQFTVTWDPNLFQFTSVSNFNVPLGINISNFGVDSAGVGFITFAWTSADLNGSNAADNDLLFSLNFDLLSNASGTVNFSDLPTQRLAFDGGTFDQIAMQTVDGNVTVTDNVAPTITCPNPAPVDAPQGQLTANVTGLQPTVADNCDLDPAVTYTQSGATVGSGTGNADGVYNAGTTTVIYTATDDAGNTATCSFQVVVNADNPVVLQLDTVDLGCSGMPTQVTVNLTVENFINIIGLQFGLQWDTSIIKLVTPVTINYITAGPPPVFTNAGGTLSFFGGHPAWPDVPNGDAILNLTFNVVPGADLSNANLIFVAPFDALDENFQPVPVLTINGAFIFTVDNVPPTVQCPTDTVLTAAANSCQVDFVPLAPSATDDCGAITDIAINPDTTIFYTGAPTVLVYTVTDEAGNTSTCVTNVTVTDVTAPVMTGCPVGPITADADLNCQAAVTWTPPTFQDACDPNLLVVPDYLPGNLFTAGTTLVNITATDASNNQTTCTFEVMVQDVTPPVIVCPNDTIVEPTTGNCEAQVNFAATASDNCDNALNIVYSHTSGSLFTGITTVTCSAVDDENNNGQCTFTITVRDTIEPVFPNGCPPNDTVSSASGNCGANPVWTIPQATDNCDATLTITSTANPGGFLAAQPAPHIITYTATDDQGNSATCTFSILVEDGTAPVLANCPSLPIIIVLPVTKCDTTLNWTPPTVSDNCGLPGVVLTSNITPPALFTTGDTIVVYTATDASGNTSTCSFFISVKDVVPPVIDCPTAPIPVATPDPCGVTPVWNFPAATDNCTPEADLIITSAYEPGDTFPAGTTTFIVRVEDASGNFAECELTVNNNILPRYINVPGPVITITDCNTPANWTPPTPVDFCPPVQETVTPLPPGSIFPFGSTVVTYTATDALGNSATATFTVVVSENIDPVIACPESPIVVNVGGGIESDPDNFIVSTDTVAGCNGLQVFFNNPNATDNCVTPILTQMGPASGSVFQLGFNQLMFTATDSSGNSVECVVFVQVVELAGLNPVVSPSPGCAGDTITLTASNIAGAIYTWTGPVNNSTTNVLTINGLSAQNDGQYIVSALVNGCPTAPDTAEVFLVQQPMAENDLDYSINPGETITFPTVFANDVLTPAFDFGICNISPELAGLQFNDADGTFTYTAGEEPGMVSFFYTVCSRTCALSEEAAVTITINDTKCVFIPNIITPNGDDANDYFVIPCIDTGLFRENSLLVFNQWGDQVYEASPYSNDPLEAWRGTLNGEDGKDLPDGVYFYIFKPGPNVAPMKGFLEIFR
ncbi:MAG TPA: HYR domain-containing protein [Saprospiraceae bacterium]|nr:HYR domain-containing protein [Saprospiraceae bacterium]